MICPQCGNEFTKKNIRGRQTFCSPACCYQAYQSDKRGLRLAETLACPVCGKDFVRQWPAVTKATCSQLCSDALYRETNRGRLNQAAKDWGERNRLRRLEIQRKWNASEKGQISKHKYQEANKDEVTRKYLESYHANKTVRDLQHARIASRRKLKRSQVPEICICCGATQHLHCHHIDFNPLNKAITNLQWLCVTCHNLTHSEGGLSKERFISLSAGNAAEL